MEEIQHQLIYPKQSMYGIFPSMYHKNQPNVGKYTHTWMVWVCRLFTRFYASQVLVWDF